MEKILRVPKRKGPLRRLCVAFVGVFINSRSSLLSFAPFRTPLGFARPTLSQKERFAEFKGNKQVIKRFNAIMYLKSISWQISDIEINFKSCNGLNRRFSQAHDVGKDRVVKYIVVYRHF